MKIVFLILLLLAGISEAVTQPHRSTAKDREYAEKIGKIIHKQYVCPDVGEKDLSVAVNIIIQKDGSIHIGEITKKSGNRLFDKCALLGIQRAGKVPPPPDDVDNEIEITFKK